MLALPRTFLPDRGLAVKTLRNNDSSGDAGVSLLGAKLFFVGPGRSYRLSS